MCDLKRRLLCSLRYHFRWRFLCDLNRRLQCDFSSRLLCDLRRQLRYDFSRRLMCDLNSRLLCDLRRQLRWNLNRRLLCDLNRRYSRCLSLIRGFRFKNLFALWAWSTKQRHFKRFRRFSHWPDSYVGRHYSAEIQPRVPTTVLKGIEC